MNTKRINSLVSDYNKGKTGYNTITTDDFIMNAKRYIKAIKQGRMICSIDSVSSSGMSRTIKFVEMAKDKNRPQYYMLNFYNFFNIMGYNPVKDSDYFRIHGCGMDMIFHTNYTIINKLHWYGLITKKTCTILEQNTPNTI